MRIVAALTGLLLASGFFDILGFIQNNCLPVNALEFFHVPESEHNSLPNLAPEERW